MRLLSRRAGVVAAAAGVLLVAASSAAGARTAADVAIFISVGSAVGANLPTFPNGATATVASRNFAAGVRIRNAGPESASLRFRLELPAGLRWGSDAPDPSEDCTGTETTAECQPPTAFEQTASVHPLGFAWDVVAAQPGSYTLRATIVSASTSDPDASNNTATVTVVVSEPSAGGGGGAAVTASRVSVAPTKPKAGTAVTASVRVLAGGAPVRPTRVRCSGTLGGRTLAGTPRATTGRATCVYRPPRSARGKTLRGTIAFRVGTTNMTRRFSIKLR
jgi:hypothetical protein